MPRTRSCKKGTVLVASRLKGKVGPTGPAGATGPAGVAGPIGPTGPDGATGVTGPAGPTGLQGMPGVQGLPGPTGPAGETGASGNDGLTGASGEVGPTGASGEVGPTGPEGPAGETAALAASVPGVTGSVITPNDFELGNISGVTGADTGAIYFNTSPLVADVVVTEPTITNIICKRFDDANGLNPDGEIREFTGVVTFRVSNPGADVTPVTTNCVEVVFFTSFSNFLASCPIGSSIPQMPIEVVGTASSSCIDVNTAVQVECGNCSGIIYQGGDEYGSLDDVVFDLCLQRSTNEQLQPNNFTSVMMTFRFESITQPCP